MRLYRVAAVTVLLGCGPVLLPAQSFSFSGAGLYATLSGADFDGVNAGLGGDVQLRYHAARGISIGGGVQYTSHSVDGINENFGVTGFFADARYAFQGGSSLSVTPYLGARVVLTHYSISSSGSDLKASGTAFGPAGGMLIRLTPATQLDVGLVWYSVHFGDAELNGTTQSGTDSNGSSLALRAGVVIGFGKR